MSINPGLVPPPSPQSFPARRHRRPAASQDSSSDSTLDASLTSALEQWRLSPSGSLVSAESGSLRTSTGSSRRSHRRSCNHSLTTNDAELAEEELKPSTSPRHHHRNQAFTSVDFDDRVLSQIGIMIGKIGHHRKHNNALTAQEFDRVMSKLDDDAK